jgi:hypothetical protein
MTNFTELAQSIRFDNASKGFDPTEGGVERYYLLAISEICEAQNELRDGHAPTHVYYSTQAGYSENRHHGDSKPEGFSVEIADAIIRILDIQAKMNYEIKVYQGNYEFDPSVSLDKELLGVIECIATCFRPHTDIAYKLNLALNGLLQICHNLDIKVIDVINEKLAYNRTRPPKHGRKF